ncbi:nucleoside hydrolase-like domain-containing protein [Telluria sp. Tellsp104]
MGKTWKSLAIVASSLAMLAGGPCVAAHAARPQPQAALERDARQRLVVLTDIGGEPDDSESLVRLMLYSNQIDIEGLIATTSVWMKQASHPEAISTVIEAYGKVRPNLLLHEAGFPKPEILLKKLRTGQRHYGIEGIGKGKESDGSRLIVQALESDDPRPLWVVAWGGINTLGQAMHTIRETRSPADVRKLTAKLRVYAISDQDDAGPWLRKNFPDLFYIVSPGGYGNATWTAINSVIDGIDNSAIGNKWLAQHIQQGHGPLGAAYPDVGWGMEGDTPSFLGLIPNGLNVPDRPDFGGWGGRYEFYTPSVSGLGDHVEGGVPIEAETRPIWSNATDSYMPYGASDYGRAHKPATKVYKDFRTTLWRWRDEFQNDFAARMDWSVKSYAAANHPPVPRLAMADQISVHSGEIFNLSAAGTTDPDGDSLSFLWFHYPEAGTWKSVIPAEGAENVFHVAFRAPVVAKPETAHFILKVTDKGSPPLTRYKRVIVTVLPAS